MVPSGEYVVYLYGTATFNCISFFDGSPVQSVTWLLNDTMLDVTQEDIEISFGNIGNGIGVLKITNISIEYDMARISCEAHFESGTPVMRSVEATIILVQG